MSVMYSLPQIVPSNMVLDLPTSMYTLPKIHVTENIGNGSNGVSKLAIFYQIDCFSLNGCFSFGLLGFYHKNGATQFLLPFFLTIDNLTKE